MNSMTGHGRGEAIAGGLRVVVECFSVNRKQGEVSVAAPRDFAGLEPRIREDVLKKIARGKVHAAVSIEPAPDAAPSLIDQERAAAFLREARALQKKLGLAGEVSLETILAAPGVVKTVNEAAKDPWPQVRRALATAMDALIAMRVREGAHLRKELTRGEKRLATLRVKVLALAPRVPARQRENLVRRLESARLPLDVLDPRLATEIAFFAERCDITEEMTRLESHHQQFREQLEATAPVGRTLEFLVQEMGREWNTTGSKANDAAISRLVVEAKAELDKLREQLANIE